MGISSCIVDPRKPGEKSTKITTTCKGSHLFKIDGVYSDSQRCLVGYCFTSDTFTVGGHDWSIMYYPAGRNWNTDKGRYIDFGICLKSDSSDDVTAKFTVTVLNNTGRPSNLSYSSDIVNFRKHYPDYSASLSTMTYSQLSGSNCLEYYSFRIRCTVIVIKEICLQNAKPYLFTVPSSNLLPLLVDQLETGEGTDVSFKVNGENFDAHSCLLAASSPVFKAKLSGSMKGKTTETIEVLDVEPSIFKSMIHFIYTDSVPQFEDANNSREASIETAQHLLVAADRFGLQRLKRLCEKKIYEYIDAENVATILSFTEQYNCTELKAACLKFVEPPEVLAAAVLSEGFENLMTSYPTILKDLRVNHNH